MTRPIILLFLSLSAFLMIILASCSRAADDAPPKEEKQIKKYSVYIPNRHWLSLIYEFEYDSQNRVTRYVRAAVDSMILPVKKDTSLFVTYTYNGTNALPSGYIARSGLYTYTHLLFYDGQNRVVFDSCKSISPALPSNTTNTLGGQKDYTYSTGQVVSVTRDQLGRAPFVFKRDTVMLSNNNVAQYNFILFSPSGSSNLNRSSYTYGNLTDPLSLLNITTLYLDSDFFGSKKLAITKFGTTTVNGVTNTTASYSVTYTTDADGWVVKARPTVSSNPVWSWEYY